MLTPCLVAVVLQYLLLYTYLLLTYNELNLLVEDAAMIMRKQKLLLLCNLEEKVFCSWKASSKI